MTESMKRQSVTATLMLDGAAKAIELYKKAFGATEVYRMEAPGSKRIMHACIRIGDSNIFLADTNPEMGCGTPSVSNFYLSVDNVDSAFKQAKTAGMSEMSAVQDMFWGDRVGNVKDSFGINWTISTHVRDLSQDEIAEGAKKFAAQKSKAA